MTLRVALGIDPGNKTGLGAWVVAGVPGSKILARGELVDITRAGWGESQAIAVLDGLVGPGCEWIAAVEAPWAHTKGRAHTASQRAFTSAPTFSEKFWRRVIDQFARWRAARAGVVFRKPMLLRPRPEDWRGRLGVATRGHGASEEERRAFVKDAAVQRLKRLHGLDIQQVDIAEAVSIAEWLAHLAALPLLRVTPTGKLVPPRFCV